MNTVTANKEIEYLYQPADLATRQLAIQLHDRLCIDNHIDGCGWPYETQGLAPDIQHDWSGWTHRRWFDLARAAVKFMKEYNIDLSEAGDLIDLIKLF